MNNNLLNLAFEAQKAERAYEKAFRLNIETLEPLEDDLFWPLVDLMTVEIVKGLEMVVPRDCEKAIEHFIWRLFFGDLYNASKTKVENVERVCRFIRAYNRTKYKVYKALDKHEDLDMGDDGFGDYCDSFIVLGREAVEAVARGDFKNMADVRRYVETTIGTRFPTANYKKIATFLGGENYIEMTLTDAAKDKSASVARELLTPKTDDSL